MNINPYFEVIFAATIWGLTGSFIRILHLPSTTLSFIRSAVPTIILFIYFLINRKNVFRNSNVTIYFASFLNAIRILFYFIGFQMTSIGNAVIILYTGPIFTSFFES